MAIRRTVAGVAFIVAGMALLAWVVYDAGRVLETLRLGAVASEASVALAGLLVGLASIVLGAVSWRGPRHAPR